MKDSILLVDDDQEIRSIVKLWLEKEGFRVITAEDGKAALRQLYNERPDLVILDVMMPNLDGWETCRRVREVSDAGVIMLTARAEGVDRVRGLELGADDYLCKPFEFPELLARIKAVLRRTRVASGTEKENVFSNGRLCVDFASREVRVDGEPVELSPTEFRMLAFLIENQGRVLTQKQVLSNVWGPEYVESPGYVKLYIRYLREKIEEDPSKPKFILTEWGVGYRFVKTSKEDQAKQPMQR